MTNAAAAGCDSDTETDAGSCHLKSNAAPRTRHNRNATHATSSDDDDDDAAVDDDDGNDGNDGNNRNRVSSTAIGHIDDGQSISDSDDDDVDGAASSFDSEEEDDDNDDDTDEVPVWVRGARRWISGLTADTTCGQLVEALLRDDGILSEATGPAATAALLAQYVISEKWRSVEQILAGETKVLNIWTAWGEAQSQVSCAVLGLWDLGNGLRQAQKP